MSGAADTGMRDAGKTIALFYKWTIIISGLTVLGWATIRSGLPDIFGALSLVVLAILAESQSVPIGGEKSISVGFAIDLCALLIYGPVTAAWVVFLSVFLSITKVDESRGYVHLFNIPLPAMLFNCTNLVLSIFTAGKVYELLGGKYIAIHGSADIVSFTDTFRFLSPYVLSLVAAIFAHIMINTGVIAIYLALMTGNKALSQWVYNFRWSIINLFIVGVIGLTITLVYRQFGNIGLLLFTAPLLLARYTFVQYIRMREVYLNTIKALTAAIEAKDKYTMGHSQRVEEYSLSMAREMKLTPDRIETLRYAALLHDIGKIGIAENVLNKPGRLSEEEFDQIRKHPEIGAKILEGVSFLKRAMQVIMSHHERHDGKGYPHGIKEQEIPLESQIMSVADAFDAMTSDRPYRKAKTLEEATEEIQQMSGTQFSPRVVEAFMRLVRKGGISH